MDIDKLVPSELSLTLLKSDLGFFGADLDPEIEKYLRNLLFVAQRTLLEQNGIDLVPGEVSDDQLCAMYAAWIYRNRATGAGKPPMLKDEIRDRQVHKAIASVREREAAGA